MDNHTSKWFEQLMKNPIIGGLPDHLKQYVVDQNHESYTPVDHAVWRYVLRQARHFHRDRAHRAYLEGLEKTGLETERIPAIHDMNRILEKIGWAAVPVEGFIPPAAFMEFQAHRVLVVAADMRQLKHIEYTPSPDIIHEAAGHAPIIADPEYAEYLRRIGEVGSKAMSSQKDHELYEAIRKLSVLKESRHTPDAEIKAAEQDVLNKQENLGTPSEMALLSRLHWWTVEFGLVGDIHHPKIYGAGLLSSIGEAASCLKDDVKKIPYSIDTANYAFDITTKQPQLFVTPNFKHLNAVLEEFSRTMAFRTGGLPGMEKAVQCRNTATAELSSGLQISGTFNEVITDENKRPVYISTEGPTSLAFEYRQLEGHNKSNHVNGFSCPTAPLKNTAHALEEMTPAQLRDMGIIPGQHVLLEFGGDITVDGTVEKYVHRHDRLLMLVFTDCTVSRHDRVLVGPSWPVYHMGVGEAVVSVFAGAADKDAFEQPSLVSRTRTIKTQYNEDTLQLHGLYQKVRQCREKIGETGLTLLTGILQQLKTDYPDDWLLPLEILEILEDTHSAPAVAKELHGYLKEMATQNPEVEKLIHDGLNLLYDAGSKKRR